MSPPVSAQARGEVRALCAQLEAEANRVDAAVAALPPAMLQAATRKGVLSRKAIANVIDRLAPLAVVHRRGRAVVWRSFRVASLPGEAPARPGIAVRALVLNAAGRTTLAWEGFGLAFWLHSIERLRDRSGFSADPLEAMREAHDALLLLDEQNGRRLVALERFMLPTTAGAFLATGGRYGRNAEPLVVARTWVAGDQLRRDQSADLDRWAAYLNATTLPTTVHP